MNAYDFCKFFDYTLEKATGIDNDGDKYFYIATDDQGVFSNRYGMKPSDFSGAFEICHDDYIDGLIEDYGFEYDTTKDGGYYIQALAWIADSTLKDDIVAEVIEALVYPEKLTA